MSDEDVNRKPLRPRVPVALGEKPPPRHENLVWFHSLDYPRFTMEAQRRDISSAVLCLFDHQGGEAKCLATWGIGLREAEPLTHFGCERTREAYEDYHVVTYTGEQNWIDLGRPIMDRVRARERANAYTQHGVML